MFFFSSRRRHTRWPRDWSSDVCSSDLQDHGSSSRTGYPSQNSESSRGESAEQPPPYHRFRSFTSGGLVDHLWPPPPSHLLVLCRHGAKSSLNRSRTLPNCAQSLPIGVGCCALLESGAIRSPRDVPTTPPLRVACEWQTPIRTDRPSVTRSRGTTLTCSTMCSVTLGAHYRSSPTPLQVEGQSLGLRVGSDCPS